MNRRRRSAAPSSASWGCLLALSDASSNRRVPAFDPTVNRSGPEQRAIHTVLVQRSAATAGTGSCLRLVAHGFDIMAVRTDDKGSVVVGAVVRAQAGTSVVFASGGESAAVELVDL